MEKVLHHLVTTSWIGFIALFATCCIESSFPIVFDEELKKMTIEKQVDIASIVSGAPIDLLTAVFAKKMEHEIPKVQDSVH